MTSFEPWSEETWPTRRQFHIRIQSRGTKRGIHPKLICGLLFWLWYTVHYWLCGFFSYFLIVLSQFCSKRKYQFQTLNSQGRQHPDRPGSEVRAEKGFPWRPKLLRCGPDRHPLIRWEVSGQRDAGGCTAQRDRRGPVCRGPSLPQVCFLCVENKDHLPIIIL